MEKSEEYKRLNTINSRPVFLPQSVEDFSKVLMQNSHGKTEAVITYLQDALKLKPTILKDRPVGEELEPTHCSQLVLCYRQYITRRIKATIEGNIAYDNTFQVLLHITRADFLVLLESVPKKYHDRLMKDKLATIRNNVDCSLTFYNEKHIKHILTKGSLTITVDNVVRVVDLLYPIKVYVQGSARKVYLEIKTNIRC